MNAHPRPSFLAALRNWRWWRWLLPTPGNVLFTLLVVGILFYTQSVGAFPARAPATSANTIPYQGRLADASGAPVNGAVMMTFKLYDIDSGGVALWTETWPSVQVNGGLFNVLLGSITSIPQSTFADNDSLWLGVTVGGDSEMTPRVQLGSVPFAASVPDGTITSSKLALTVATDGDETDATTTSPTYVKLHEAAISIDRTSTLWVSWQAHVSNNLVNDGGNFRIYLDGSTSATELLRAHYTSSAAELVPISIGGAIPNVTAGTHTIELWWSTRGAGQLLVASRLLSVVAFGQ